MTKQQVIRFLRRSHFLTTAERLRFIVNVVANIRANRRFALKHPGLQFPPLWLAYDAYSSCDREWYWKSGNAAADAILGYVPSAAREEKFSVLEWGCGSGRILRQLRSRLPQDRVTLCGSDYNAKTISWCRKSLAGIEFAGNGLNPPLSYRTGQFDLVYSVSVYTHLPEGLFRPWLVELFRVVKIGGIVLITLNGERFLGYLSTEEKDSYERTGFASRGSVYFGSRLYNAYHRRDYVERACADLGRIISVDCTPTLNLAGGQDVYLLKKG